MTTPIYFTAIAKRSDGWWAVDVPEISGLFTQARRLNQIDDMVRDAARTLGREIGDVKVEPQLSE